MRRILVAIVQNLTCIFNKLVFSFFLKYEIIGLGNLSGVKGPLIVVANHVSRVDPFLIGVALPFASPILPIRFAIAPEYYYNPFLFPFLWLWGGFPVFKGIGIENALKTPLRILKNGGMVGIFPEGKIRHLGRPPKGRRGIGYLGLHSDAKILPIRIEGTLNLGILKFFTRRAKAVITIGKPFTVPQDMKTLGNVEAIAEFIAEKMMKEA